MRRSLPITRINASLTPDWSLDDGAVAERKTRHGLNDIIEEYPNRWIELIKDTCRDPMIWFLIGTSILFAIMRNYNQAIILLLATLPLIGMDAFLHWRTQASTRSLGSKLAVYATVIRNGKTRKISVRELVPGDLVIVDSGDPFPADGIIVTGNNIQVDESILTGESFPVTKQILTILPEGSTEPTIDSLHWGFAGTRLLMGKALLRIVFTGKETLYGEIVSSALQTKHTKTPLQKAINKLVLLLILVATIVCILLALVRLFQGFGFIDAILSAATLAVAALPDEFPVVFTFFLGVGVYRLAHQKALVRRAVSVENIGRVTCICSDKTGTITEGRFQLSHYNPNAEFDNQTLLDIAALASRLDSGDPLDFTILNETTTPLSAIAERIKTFPFTEDRKRETVLVRQKSGQLLFATKGAPELILSLTTLTEPERQKWQQRTNELAATGHKVLGCASYYITEMSANTLEPNANYQFVGLLAFEDPPRKEVSSAVRMCHEGNIHILMITGDHPETSKAIAKKIGLSKGQPEVLLAQEAIIKLHENGPRFLRTIDVIARASPSQKLTVIKALQSIGEIVAVTGDGVNDVPAIRTADIGIAMGTRGAQSAREVADIVLLDDNFSSLVHAIAEGRQLFKNLQKSFKYLLTIHAPFVISAAVIPLLGFPLLYFPIHIVWIELFIHPTSMLVFQNLPITNNLEPVKPRSKLQFFAFTDWLGIIFTSLFSTVIVILSYILILKISDNVLHARAFALATLGFISAGLTIGLAGFKSLIARTDIFCTIILTIFLIQTPLFAGLLSIQPLHIYEWILIMITSVITILLVKV